VQSSNTFDYVVICDGGKKKKKKRGGGGRGDARSRAHPHILGRDMADRSRKRKEEGEGRRVPGQPEQDKKKKKKEGGERKKGGKPRGRQRASLLSYINPGIRTPPREEIKGKGG